MRISRAIKASPYQGVTRLLTTLKGHVIKPRMEMGNEMKQNEIDLQCSDGYLLKYSLNNNSAYFPYHRRAHEIKLSRKTHDAQTCDLP